MFRGFRFFSGKTPLNTQDQTVLSPTAQTDTTADTYLTAPSSPPFQEEPILEESSSTKSSNMGNESRPDLPPRSEEESQQLNIVDPDALPDKPGAGSTPAPSEFGTKSEAAPEEAPKEGEPELTEEEKQAKLDDEERTKVMKRMANIVDKGLDKVTPLLDMIDQTIDEAEKKKESGDLDEDAFVNKMKPLIENAHAVMQSTFDQIKALDPDNKFERLAKRHVEDAQATADEKQVIDGCNELSTRVKATIDKGRKAIEGMPKAKRELGPLFNMLSEPLLQILGAVGLLVAGVLNLLANILNALGLGGALTQVLQGLRITNLLESMGYSVGGSKKK